MEVAPSPSIINNPKPKPEPQPEPQNPLPSSTLPQSQPNLTLLSSSSSSSSIPSSLPLSSPLTNPPLPTPLPFFTTSPMSSSFNPITQIPINPQFPHPNPSPQPPSLQPPGVLPSVPISVSMLPQHRPAPLAPGVISITVSSIQPPGVYQVHGQPNPSIAAQHFHPTMQPFAQMPNGFAYPSPQTMASSGIPRYPSPYTAMIHPNFPPRQPVGMVPPLSRPPVLGIRGVPPAINPAVRPAVPIVAVPEKPQTTVYVGKIAPTVENDFILSLLSLCGPVKNWKRAQDPTNMTPRGFGFCEFESAEGVLRALRLLTKLNIDGHELVLNVNQATKEYLDRYVQKKVEREITMKEGGSEDATKEDETAPVVENQDQPKPSSEDSKQDNANDSIEKSDKDVQTFGIVTDEDRATDRDALEKLTNMMEERLKANPLPPPPPMQTPTGASGKSNSDVPSKSRDGDSDVDIMKNDAAEDKNDDETTSENKPNNEHERPEPSSSDMGRRYGRWSRERDRETDLKREKERELVRFERERERERVRREREREFRTREAERLYKERVKEWESREKEREYQRKLEKEREKESERDRRREVKDQEDEIDDEDSRKRRRRSGVLEEKRRKRQREKVDDLDDRLREEEEIAEAKRRAIEDQQQQKDEAKLMSSPVINGNEQTLKPIEGNSIEGQGNPIDQAHENNPDYGNSTGETLSRNGFVNGEGDESAMGSFLSSDLRQNNSSLPARKLGFGLVGTGKRAAVPSVFHQEDDEDLEKDKKMRPLVPIDYSNEEMQVVQATSGAPPNLAAAAEFAKRITNINPKEEKLESERERSKRSNEKILNREREWEHSVDKAKVLENKKLLDAKQLIDMIPKTKEELFSYNINWTVYDQHELHERMRPWISKKITEFLGEEEATLVEFIVSSTKEHVKASQMLELLQSILDDEAEMFVLKMWRMLIFEIKKVETGLSLKTRA